MKREKVEKLARILDETLTLMHNGETVRPENRAKLAEVC
jgi:hypothetical protein